jgi:transposase
MLIMASYMEATKWTILLRHRSPREQGVRLHPRRARQRRNLRAEPEPLKRALVPCRASLVVGAEWMFSWYWLADWCRAEGIEFVLGHAPLHLLQTIPDVGKVLSLVMLYEIRDVNRFENIGQFASYARLVA